MDLLDDARAIAGDLIGLRQALHHEPEVGLSLPRTQRKVLSALEGLPLAVTEGDGLSSVTAVLQGGRPGPAVLLRAELDALPLTEQADVPFRSRFAGAMHACGHDLHAAMLVGAARLLAQRADRLAGSVVLMFQPGEEGHDGAGRMIEEGVLDAAAQRPVSAYALHVSSNYWPGGRFATRPGPLMAASGRLTVDVRGQGGHGSAPHHARNPIPAACAMIGELPGYLTRTLDPAEPAVLSVGTVHSGTAASIVPETARFEATLRTFGSGAGERVARGLARLCEHIAAAHGVAAQARFTAEYPVTIAAPAESRFAADVVRELFGDERYEEMTHPLTASEDFSRVLAQVPGTIVQLGACPAGQDPGSAPSNHSPHVIFDDAVIADGAALYAALALYRLAGHAAGTTTTSSPAAPRETRRTR